MGTAGLASVVLLLFILAHLTQKWEAVTRSKSGFRLFYVAAALVALASLVRLVRIGYLLPSDAIHPQAIEELLTTSGLSALGPVVSSTSRSVFLLTYSLFEPQSWFYLVFYHLSLALAATGSLILAWRNWGWLLREGNE
jgi:hypothetical protein